MEISKLFASVGFRVDTKNLDTFENRLAGAQVKIVNFAGAIDNIGKQASQAITPVNNLLRALDFKGKSAGITPLANALERLEKVINQMNVSQFHSNIQKLTYALNEARPNIHKNANAWDRYADAVTRAKLAVGGSWSMGGRAPTPPNGAGGGSTIIPIGGGHSSSPHYTPQSRLLAPLVGSHLAYLASGGVMAGVGGIYATKAILDTAQENVTAENFVRMASKDDKEFEENKKWLWEKSMYYGTDIDSNMEGFGKIYMNTKNSLGRDKSLDMMENLMRYNTAMHTTTDSQKMINKSLYQMASTGRVNAADYNQWEEHVAGGSEVAGLALDKLVKEGHVDKNWRKKFGSARAYITNKDNAIQGKYMVPALTEAMSDFTEKGVATGIDSYQSAGGRFKNKLKLVSRDMAEGGLFDMAKGFLNALSSLIDIVQALMPVINIFTSTLGALFQNFAIGLTYIKDFLKEVLVFNSFTDSATRGVLQFQIVFWALCALMLPKALSKIKWFFTAVRAIMASNPILLGLMAIITVLGFFYGQWKRQKEGLSNWLDFFNAVLYLIKEGFLYNFESMRLYWYTFLGFLRDGIEALPKIFSNVWDAIVSRFSFIDDLIKKMKELIGLGEEQEKQDKKRQTQDLTGGRGIPFLTQPIQNPVANMAPVLLQRPVSFNPATVNIMQNGRVVGQTQISVANAVTP